MPKPPGIVNQTNNGAFGESALPDTSNSGGAVSPKPPLNINSFPQRKIIPHRVPDWVSDGSIYFITVNGRPPGLNQFAKPEIAASLRESIRFREDRGEWFMHVILFMPDHVHALVTFVRDAVMSNSISQWKRFTARNFGLHWQRDYFDHRLRNDENHVEKAHYIRMNPVRKGLCEKPEDWPYVWSSSAW